MAEDILLALGKVLGGGKHVPLVQRQKARLAADGLDASTPQVVLAHNIPARPADGSVSASVS